MTKAEIRKGALERRAGVGGPERDAYAARLAEVGLQLVDEFMPLSGRPVVSLFSRIGSEPDMRPLAVALEAAGATVVLPVTWSHGDPLLFRVWSPGDRTSYGALGIAEPLEGVRELDPDVLFVPLCAFDRRGHRIGYGAGHFDRTLEALRRRKSIRAIGVGYAVQEVLFVPSEAHDQPVDVMLTDRDILLCTD